MVIYKSSLEKAIKIKDKKDEDILWLKIDKNLFGTSEDLLLGTAYTSPKNSKVRKEQPATDTFEVLLKQVESFSEGAPMRELERSKSMWETVWTRLNQKWPYRTHTGTVNKKTTIMTWHYVTGSARTKN